MAGFHNFGAARKKWSGLKRIGHSHWVKICVDPNGQINLRAKQKYEVLLATPTTRKIILCFYLFIYLFVSLEKFSDIFYDKVIRFGLIGFYGISTIVV